MNIDFWNDIYVFVEKFDIFKLIIELSIFILLLLLLLLLLFCFFYII